MRNPLIALLILLAGFLLSACGSSSHFAPVTNGGSAQDISSRSYRVQPDDTLYSIAFRYGLDYRKLADANHISSPYHIVTGQKLILLPEASDISTSPEAKSLPVVTTGAAPVTPVTSQPVTSNITTPPPVTTEPEPATNNINSTGPVGKWLWPASGRVLHTFSDAYGGDKGIDIAGKSGDPVKATAAGRVVYSGSGLRGYGLLLILKHNAEYLSAYAHNSKLLVKEGDVVKAGQAIALMGNTGTTRVSLHFEIRQEGKPVDPLKLLTPR